MKILPSLWRPHCACAAASASTPRRSFPSATTPSCRQVPRSSSFTLHFSAKLLPDHEDLKDRDEDDHSASNEPKPGTAEFIIQIEGRRSIKVVDLFYNKMTIHAA
jgi:hypothetical protein